MKPQNKPNPPAAATHHTALNSAVPAQYADWTLTASTLSEKKFNLSNVTELSGVSKFWNRRVFYFVRVFKTLRTGDADLRFYITTVQDGWRKSAFLTGACFPCTINLIMQYIEPVSEWSCWRMFVETWPHFELTFRHRASSI